MTWQVIEYMNANPQATNKDILIHFAEELELEEQIKILKSQVDEVSMIRDQLRPLYRQKFDNEHQITLMKSDFDMEVMLKYPPRKGTEKERKAYMNELQENSEDFQALVNETDSLKEKITILEDSMSDIQQRGKNAGKVIDLFNSYVSMLSLLNNQPAQVQSVPVNDSSNHNVF